MPITLPYLVSSSSATTTIYMQWVNSTAATGTDTTTYYFTSPLAVPREQTPAERAAAAQDTERRNQERAARQAEEQAAKERAERLLVGHLTEEQRQELAQHDRFTVRVLRPNGESATYRIRRGRVQNVDLLNAVGRRLRTYCIHPAEYVPDADTMLAQKMMLEAAEDEFLRIANVS